MKKTLIVIFSMLIGFSVGYFVKKQDADKDIQFLEQNCNIQLPEIDTSINEFGKD